MRADGLLQWNTFLEASGSKVTAVGIASGAQGGIFVSGHASQLGAPVDFVSNPAYVYVAKLADDYLEEETTIKTIPAMCTIPTEPNQCSVTYKVTNAKSRSLQVWVKSPFGN